MFACPWKGSPFLSSFPLSSLLPSREMEGSQTCNAKYFTNILLLNHRTAPCEVERGGLARPGLPSWEAVRAAFIFSLLLSLRPPPLTFPLQLLNSHPEALLTSSISAEKHRHWKHRGWGGLQKSLGSCLHSWRKNRYCHF